MAKGSVQGAGTVGAVSLVTFVGALVYFLGRATDFWSVVLAILEAMVWPAILVFHALSALHA
ncbi:hypothetical protein [Amnibacterium kyonggiense]|uniref:Uncharacterized protein n=1 Tax=Amnibacterium kyonggiense TaxID=595671 RepID=A0A4R7FKK4_9MICO|nr:hypothetical protein [Amnibacterium kyonggiense]TDS76886.1 hypothetical protein CLV52_1825 [Amnibacterium kyonggiense]